MNRYNQELEQYQDQIGYLLICDSPDYWFFGGVLMILCGFLEWVLGNTFPSVGMSFKVLDTL